MNWLQLEFLFVLDFDFLFLLDILRSASIGLWCLHICAALAMLFHTVASLLQLLCEPKSITLQPFLTSSSPLSCRTYLTQLLVLQHPFFYFNFLFFLDTLLPASIEFLHLYESMIVLQNANTLLLNLLWRVLVHTTTIVIIMSRAYLNT